jgi:hypothetical protein
MIRKHFRKRLALGLAVGAVVAAVVAPTAQGHVYLPGAVVQSHQQPTVMLPGKTAAGAALANQKHDAYPVPVSSTEATGSTSFNWSDAGIGASVTFGVLLLLLTAVVLGRRQRSRGLASA